MTTFDEYVAAQRLDKIIETKVTTQIDKQRPRPRYAVVKEIDPEARKAKVTYIGESSVVTIPFGLDGPSEVNQYVRIEGVPGDRYISSVLGTALIETILDQTNTTAENANSAANGANDGVSSINDTLSAFDARPLWDGPDNTGNSSIPWISATDDVGSISTSARWGFIRTRRTTKYTSITFAAKIASGSVTSMYFDIYRISSTFSATLVYSSDNKAGGLSGTYQWFSFSFPEIIAQYGEYIAVQIRGAGGGNLQIAGKVDRVISNNVFRPRYMGGVRDSSSNPAPSTLTQSELDAIYYYAVPYIQLGSYDSAIDSGRTISDNFGGTLNKWYLRSSGTSNLLTIDDGRLAYNGNDDGRQMGIMTSPLTTQKWNVSALCDPNDRDTYMILASDNGLNTFVCLIFNDNTVKLYTVTGGPGGTWTSRGTGSSSNNSATRIATYDGQYIKVFENTPTLGQEKISWDATAAGYSMGSSRLFFGLGIERSSWNNGAKWDNFVAKDVENNYTE